MKVDIETLNVELLSKAKFYSNQLWGVEYNGEVEIQKNMRTTLGRIWFWDEPTIQISYKSVKTQNELFLDDILIHELVHWYCKQVGENFNDGKPDFENRLRQLGIGRTRNFTIWDNKVFMLNEKREKVPYQASEKLKELNTMYKSSLVNAM